MRVEPVMLIKFAPASVASAFAKSVFPVPGGPKSNIPLQGWTKEKKEKKKIPWWAYRKKKRSAKLHTS